MASRVDGWNLEGLCAVGPWLSRCPRTYPSPRIQAPDLSFLSLSNFLFVLLGTVGGLARVAALPHKSACPAMSLSAVTTIQLREQPWRSPRLLAPRSGQRLQSGRGSSAHTLTCGPGPTRQRPNGRGRTSRDLAPCSSGFTIKLNNCVGWRETATQFFAVHHVEASHMVYHNQQCKMFTMSRTSG